MNEQNILDDLKPAALAMHIPQAIDLHTILPRHATHRWRQRDVGAIQGMCWHQELGWSTVEQVAAYHTGPKSHLKAGGVESIAYTWAIRRDGQIVLCLPFAAKPWSQGDRYRPGDENAQFMSVMIEGHFDGPGHTAPDSGEPTQVQLLSALMLWRVCVNAWDWDQDDLSGHYMFGKPACPGHTVMAIVEAFRKCPLDDRDVPDNTPMQLLNLDNAKGRQQALIDLGFLAGEADGIWGVMSKAALMEFQRSVDLVADGVWGKNTEREMVSTMTEGPR